MQETSTLIPPEAIFETVEGFKYIFLLAKDSKRKSLFKTHPIYDEALNSNGKPCD